MRHRQDLEYDPHRHVSSPQAAKKKRAQVDAELIVVEEEEEVPREKKKLTGGRHKAEWKKMGLFEKGNIGVPVIVVGTRADELAKIAEEQHSHGKEHYLNYIQSHLRKWCVARGAALLFTSEKEKGSNLREYLLFRLSKIPTSNMKLEKVTPQIPSASYTHESLFIPAYSDALENIVRLPLGQFADCKFEDVVKPLPKKERAEKKEVVETFAEFLESQTKKMKEGGLTIGSTERPDKPSRRPIAAPGRDRPGRDPPAAGTDKLSVESEAERFFSDMIKTYRPGTGTSRSARSGAARKPADAGAK